MAPCRRPGGAGPWTGVLLLVAVVCLPVACARSADGTAAAPGGPPGGKDAGVSVAAGRKPGTTVPADISFTDIRGVRKAIDFRRGRPVLLNFWATWCVPCIDELPELGALAREYGNGRAEFLGVSLDAWIGGENPETEGKVKRALEDTGVGYPNLIYRGDQDPLVEEFDMSGAIPYSILYDPGGHPARMWEGRVEISELREALEKLR